MSDLARFKLGFFDRQKVLKPADRAARRVLSKFGAFVRTTARTSIRYGKKSSAPGAPPTAHRGASRVKTNKKGVSKRQAYSPLRDFLFFAYEPTRQNVVIGPALLRDRGGGRGLQALEDGGPVTLGKGARAKQVRLRAFPFMGPAFRRELKTLPALWAGSIK